MGIIFLYISPSKYGQHVHVDELTSAASFSVVVSCSHEKTATYRGAL